MSTEWAFFTFVISRYMPHLILSAFFCVLFALFDFLAAARHYFMIIVIPAALAAIGLFFVSRVLG